MAYKTNHSAVHRDLRTPKYRKRVVEMKTRYTRKTKHKKKDSSYD